MSVPPGRAPTAFAGLCWVLGVLTVVVPGVAFAWELLDPSTGMFRDLWLAMAVGIVAPALNLLSFIANLLYARHRRWAVTWLNGVLLVQGLCVGASLWLWGSLWLDSHREERAAERWSRVYDAAKRNNPAEIAGALDSCAAHCAKDLDRFLLAATADAAHRSMEYLLSRGANPTPALDANAASLDLRTCEGTFLASLSSLGVSVARGDAAGMDLLMPKSHASGRRKAAWVAAQRDRLDLLQRLIEAGVPLATRGAILDENVTFLNAAASGAALRTGAWLLKEKRFNANGDPVRRDPYAGETPLVSLVRFAASSPDSPRIRPFLGMLLAHGADIEGISPRTGEAALQVAIGIRSHAAVGALIEAGASERSLTVEDRARWLDLRQNPPVRLSVDARNCIP